MTDDEENAPASEILVAFDQYIRATKTPGFGVARLREDWELWQAAWEAATTKS